MKYVKITLIFYYVYAWLMTQEMGPSGDQMLTCLRGVWAYMQFWHCNADIAEMGGAGGLL